MPVSPVQPVRPIFISYSRVDREFARKLYTDLSDLGFAIWRDIHDIPAGEDWWRQIREAIEACDTLVLLMSLPALKSTYVSEEWNYARSLGKRVIPIISDEIFQHPEVESGEYTIPGWMQRTNWMDFREGISERDATWQNFVNSLRRPYEPRQVKVTDQAQRLPHNFVPRQKEFEALLKLLVRENQQPVTITAALRGAGGYGKTTFARALCRDMRVTSAFDDGVFWVTLGERLSGKSPETLENELLSRMLDLIYEMTGVRPPLSGLEAAQEKLVRAIGDRYILLVVDDVWHQAHLKPFLVRGKNNATLITTRDDSTVPRDATRLIVDAMSSADALALLAAGIQPEARGLHDKDLRALAKRLGNWSLLLGIVNGSLRDRLDRLGMTLTDALYRINEQLNRRGLTAFDPQNPVERIEAVKSTLDASIEQLEKVDVERYRMLGIFPPDEAIPLRHVSILWNLDEFDTEELCERLSRGSLLQNYDGRNIYVHDVVREYLSEQLGRSAPVIHIRLLDAWGTPRENGYKLPDMYAWNWYIYHTDRAGRDVRSFLLDFGWLQARLDSSGISTLLSDYDMDPPDAAVKLVQSALSMSAHVLTVDKKQLAAQLAGRLFSYKGLPQINGLLQTITISAGTFYPQNAALHQSGELLLRTLQGHKGYVAGAKQLADGYLLSWSGDHTLRLWSVDGQPTDMLEGHTNGVIGAQQLADGRLLSWSGDQTLRLWTAKGQPLAVLEGHIDDVIGARQLADGNLLSWSGDQTLRLWTVDGQPLAVLEGHTMKVNGTQELADGNLLSWSEDHTLRLWTVDGQPLAVLEGHIGYVAGGQQLTNGNLLSWSGDQTLRLWTARGQPLAEMQGHPSNVSRGQQLADGNLLSRSWDGTLRLWTVDGQPLAILKGHTEDVYGVQQLADGNLLSWSDDHTLRLWTVDGQPLVVLKGHTKGVKGAKQLADGNLLSWSDDHTLRLWTVDGQPLVVLKGHTKGVKGAQQLTNGNLLSWSDDQTLRLWSVGEQVLTMLHDRSDSVRSVKVLQQLVGGNLLSWSDDGMLRLWAIDGQLVAELNNHPKGLNGPQQLVDGHLLSWSADGTLLLWTVDGQLVAELKGHTNIVIGAQQLADGRLLSWSADGTLRLWTVDGQLVAELKGHTNIVIGAQQLADGRLLSWSADGTLRLWTVDGQLVAELKGHTNIVIGAQQLANGRLLSWSADGTLRLWTVDGHILAVMKNQSGVRELADGRLLSWSADGMLRLWAIDGQLVTELKGHTNVVIGAQQLADGRLLSWSADYTLRLWTVDGQLLTILKGHTKSVGNAQQLADGRLLSRSWDGTNRLWTTNGRPLAVVRGQYRNAGGAQQLANGRLLSWADDTLWLWTIDGQRIAELKGHTKDVIGVRELADGCLLSWSEDGMLRLWAIDGQPLTTFYCDTPLTCCIPVADGHTVVAGDQQGRVIFLRLITN